MDLHRPQHLDDFQFQPSVSTLKHFLQNEIPNMIFYGVEGAGKKSLLYALLRDKYGINTKNIKYISKTLKINSKDIEFPYFYSNYHVEINISDMSNYARKILPEIIKNIGSTKNIIYDGCKVFVIHQAEKMDSFTQNMMRRIFETYYKNCRFILLTKHLNQIIKPLQSRCLLIRIPCPTIEQIKTIIPTYKNTDRNMKMAWIQQYMKVDKEDIEIYIENLLNSKKINPQDLIYSLLVKNYDFLQIVEIIYEILRKKIKNEENLKQCIELLAKYSRRICQGTREVVHLEALLLNLMIIL